MARPSGVHGFTVTNRHTATYGSETLRREWARLRPGGHVLLFETTWLHRISPHARWAVRTFGVTEQGFRRAQLRRALRRAGFEQIAFHHDPGLGFRGVCGLLGTLLRACCHFALLYPRAKNIVSACKAAEPPAGDGACSVGVCGWGEGTTCTYMASTSAASKVA